jgi:hypothetical protein
VRIAALLVALAALGACSTPRDETWIGKGVGVTVDSSKETPPAGVR